MRFRYLSALLMTSPEGWFSMKLILDLKDSFLKDIFPEGRFILPGGSGWVVNMRADLLEIYWIRSLVLT